MSFATWEAMAEELRKPFKGSGAEVTRSRRAIIEFGAWAHGNKVPLPVPVDMEADVLEQFGKSALDVYRTGHNGKLNLDGQACLDWAKKMMQASREQAVDAGSELEVEAPSHEEKLEQIRQTQEREMAEREVEVEEGEEFEGAEGAEEQYEEEEEEPQPPPRKRGRPIQPKVIVQMPKNYGRPPRQNADRDTRGRGGLNSMLPRTTSVRIFKRDEDGRRVPIDDFTSEEIGDLDIKKFVEKYIDGKHGNAPDDEGIAETEYTIFELDQRGREKGSPATFTLRVEVGQPQQQEGSDPLSKSLHTLKRAKQVLSEFQEEDPRKPYFEEAQRQAAGKGDMNQMMMLAMMEKLFSSGNTSRSDKLLELILERTGLAPRDPMAAMMMPPLPPPNWGPPPPLAPTPPSAIDKVLEVAIARMASPGPSFADQIKDMMTFQQLMGGARQSDPQMVQLLADLTKQVQSLHATQGRAPGSLEETVAGFEKIQTLVKSLAPEVGGSGGIGGFIKGLLTPEVGGLIASAIKPPEQGQKEAPGTPAPPAVAPAPAQAPRDPRKPPNPIPKSVIEAANAFKMAQTREHQVERFIDVVFAMYMTQDPFYLGFLGPAFEALNQADKSAEFLKVPRITAMRLLSETRPELADPNFVDAALAAMAIRAGAKLPDTLTSTTGTWTLDFRGNFMPLEKVGAVAVESVPAYVPQPPAEYREAVAAAPSIPATTAESLAPSANDLPPPPAVPDPAPTATAN